MSLLIQYELARPTPSRAGRVWRACDVLWEARVCTRCALRYTWLGARARLGVARSFGTRRLLGRTLKEMANTMADVAQTQAAAAGQNGATPEKKPAKLIVLIRHGQTTFNVEGRLPGQLPGVPLTEEGRRQAHQAAVALAQLPLSAVVASPLERARETAEIIARGFGVTVQLDARLMDTDVGQWSGQKIEDVAKNDPAWKEFLARPTEPPEGVENLAVVQQRAVTAVEQVREDPRAGNFVAVVAHADIVKLVLGHYLGMHLKTSLSTHIANASLSALAFDGDGPPHLLTLNWTPSPGWLVPPLPKKDAAPSAEHPPKGSVPAEVSNVNGDAPTEAEQSS